MLPRTKREVKLFEMHCFTMFITALRVILLMQLRWPKNKSLYELVFLCLFVLIFCGQSNKAATEEVLSMVRQQHTSSDTNDY